MFTKLPDWYNLDTNNAHSVELANRLKYNAEQINETHDSINHPAHYTDGKIEVIDFIEDKRFGYCLGNAVKYISRAGKKDPTKTIEDLRKAAWYIEREIQKLEETEKFKF